MTASHTFQCLGHSPALGPCQAGFLAQKRGRVSREERPQGKPVAGEEGAAESWGPGPREQREKREEGRRGHRVWRGVARALGVGTEGRPGLGQDGILGTELAGPTGERVPLDPKAWKNGCPSSMSFVAWTEVRTGPRSQPASPHLEGGGHPSRSSLSLLCVVSSPVLQSWRTTEASSRAAPTPGHLSPPPSFNGPLLPACPRRSP